MRPCDCCARERNQFDPACLRCGRRYLRDVKKTPGPREWRVAYLRSVLKVWMDQGHGEQQLRAIWGEVHGDFGN